MKPTGVILTPGPWTKENGMLSAVGKVSRGAVRKAYQMDIEAVYAALMGKKCATSLSGAVELLCSSEYFSTAVNAESNEAKEMVSKGGTKEEKGDDNVAVAVKVTRSEIKLPGSNQLVSWPLFMVDIINESIPPSIPWLMPEDAGWILLCPSFLSFDSLFSQCPLLWSPFNLVDYLLQTFRCTQSLTNRS